MFTTIQPRNAIRSFARAGGSAGITSREPIPMDRLRAVAPSIFADNRHESRSDRYTYIPTSQIVSHLTAQGYGVFAASQSGSRDEDRRGHTKHMIRFRHLDQAPMTVVGDTRPEIVLINSHDGTSKYILMAGLYRLACSNGLIVSAGTISEVRVRHSGNILEDVASGVDSLSASLPTLTDSVRTMQAIELSRPEQEVFARAALSIKYDDAPPITESQALTVRRHEDAAPTLWNTLNRVQETLIRGGDRYRIETTRGRVQRRQTQPTNSVDGSTRINRAIWQLAEEMRKLKAAA